MVGSTPLTTQSHGARGIRHRHPKSYRLPVTGDRATCVYCTAPTPEADHALMHPRQAPRTSPRLTGSLAQLLHTSWSTELVTGHLDVIIVHTIDMARGTWRWHLAGIGPTKHGGIHRWPRGHGGHRNTSGFREVRQMGFFVLSFCVCLSGSLAHAF